MKIRRPKQIPVGEDEVGPIYGWDQSGAPVCGSRKQAGVVARGGSPTCQNRARTSPSGRCRRHGGAPGSGGKIRTGMWSRSLPKHLATAYQEALLRPDLGSMRDAIAVQDALIRQYLEGLLGCPHQEMQLLRQELANAVALLEAEEESPTNALALVRTAHARAQNAVTNRETEREVRQCLRERAELVKAESVRTEKEAKYLSVEQVMALIAALVTIVNNNVKQERVRGDIAAAINKLCDYRVIEGDSSGDSSEKIIKELPQASTTKATSTRRQAVLLDSPNDD